MVTQIAVINFIPGGVPPHVKVSQGDTSERVLQFQCYFGDASYSIPSGSTVIVNGAKPGGTVFTRSATFSGNVVTLPCAEGMTDTAGKIPCEIMVTTSDGTISSANFVLEVEGTPVNDTAVSESDLSAMTELAATASQAAVDAAASAAQAALDTANTKRLGGITAITTSQNLNSLVTPGEYSIATAAIAASLSNCPISAPGRITVENGGAYNATGSWLRQTVRAYNSATALTRTTANAGSTWTNWAVSGITMVTGTFSGAIANDTVTQAGKVEDLLPGIYLAYFNAQFATSSYGGNRWAQVSATTLNAIGRRGSVMPSTTGEPDIVNTSNVFNLTSSSNTLYFYLRQNSGYSLNSSSEYSIVRLA